jgi:hypothetical protein
VRVPNVRGRKICPDKSNDVTEYIGPDVCLTIEPLKARNNIAKELVSWFTSGQHF